MQGKEANSEYPRRKTPTASPLPKSNLSKDHRTRSPLIKDRTYTQSAAVGRYYLKQNTPTESQSDRSSIKRRLECKAKQKSPAQYNTLTPGGTRRINCESFEAALGKVAQQQITQALSRMLRRRIAFGFQKIKEQLLFAETSLTSLSDTNPRPIYSYDHLPELLQAFSNVYKLRYQHVMVEAFTKISYEFKKAQERQSILRGFVMKDRGAELYRLLKRKSKAHQLNHLVKNFALMRLLRRLGNLTSVRKQQLMGKKLRIKSKTPRSMTEDSSLGNSVRLNSSSKIYRLLGGIKKDKEQPSENIYVKYHHVDDQPDNSGSYRFSQRFSENVPSTMELLNNRVQRLEDMLESTRAKPSVQQENKFQPTCTNWAKSELSSPPAEFTTSKLTMITSNRNILQFCPICLLTFCICRKPMKDFEMQCDLSITQPILQHTPANLNNFGNWEGAEITRSQSTQRTFMKPSPHSKEMELVYVPQTILRPVLIERPQTFQFQNNFSMQLSKQTEPNKLNLTIRQHPKMQPDILFRSSRHPSQNCPVDSARQPISRRNQQPNIPADRSLSKRTKFLKITSRRTSESHLL